MLDEIQMNNAELSEWREKLKSDLSVVRNDVRWIKDNLGNVEHSQRNLEKQVSWLKGVGSLVGVVLGSGLALVINIIMR